MNDDNELKARIEDLEQSLIFISAIIMTCRQEASV